MSEIGPEFDCAPSDYVIDLPVMLPKDGLAEYPRFAVNDFDAAMSRFMNLIGEESPVDDREEAHLSADREAFPILASYGCRTDHYIMPEEHALDFVVDVTGHPRSWVAAWNYRVAISDLVREHGQDWDTLSREFGKAHQSAVRYGRAGI
ncbi:hypothetical protein G6L37_05665 [Agrobacterium rubi]|nr:hypothetical protein [Agrobacterium rubi]NTF24846.1 hypothetical protein [Agrobacterium rubi]